MNALTEDLRMAGFSLLGVKEIFESRTRTELEKWAACQGWSRFSTALSSWGWPWRTI